MRIAVTGATGFLGRYIVNHLLGEGHECRCWYRETSDRGGFDEHATGRWRGCRAILAMRSRPTGW
jgi:nucleoside-diphosphate-sugar epimerase